jgi:hypothetical protein
MIFGLWAWSWSQIAFIRGAWTALRASGHDRGIGRAFRGSWDQCLALLTCEKSLVGVGVAGGEEAAVPPRRWRH